MTGHRLAIADCYCLSLDGGYLCLFTITVKKDNETSETAGDNCEATVIANSYAFEEEVEDRDAAEVGTGDPELKEKERLLREE